MDTIRFKHRFLWTALAALAVPLAGCQSAETAEAPGEQAAAETPAETSQPAPTPPPTLAVGTTLAFVVDETVSTDSHEVGATFASHLAANAFGEDGRRVLPQGAVGRWIVVESTDDNGEGEAVLVVRLEGVEANGAWHSIDATVVSSEIETDHKDSSGETAAKIGIGTAAGAIVGRILGSDAEDALKGAGVGAAMGTVVALSTRGGSAKLPRGSTLTVRLDDALRVGSS